MSLLNVQPSPCADREPSRSCSMREGWWCVLHPLKGCLLSFHARHFAAAARSPREYLEEPLYPQKKACLGGLELTRIDFDNSVCGGSTVSPQSSVAGSSPAESECEDLEVPAVECFQYPEVKYFSENKKRCGRIPNLTIHTGASLDLQL